MDDRHQKQGETTFLLRTARFRPAPTGRVAALSRTMIASSARRLAARASRLVSTTVRPILVVGSVNADIVVQVDRMPTAGETTLSSDPQARVIPGGKGANQAVAAARLAGASQPVQFVCQLGNDGHAAMLEAALVGDGVDLSGAGRVDSPSGQGLVFLQVP